MPRPFPHPTSDEGMLLSSLAKDPLAPDTPLAAADDAEFRGQDKTADVLRGVEQLRALGYAVARPQLMSLLRGSLPTEAECMGIAERIRQLLAGGGSGHPLDDERLERAVSAVLGPPQRGTEPLTLLDADGKLDTERLREQYEFQITLLASLDLLEGRRQGLGITGVDGRFRRLPSLSQIQQRLQEPALRKKVGKGFNQLLLVPFRLPLWRLINALRRELRRNEHLLARYGGLDREEPVLVWGGFCDYEGLVYHPQRYAAANHGGRTKAEHLAAGHSGWDVLLTQGTRINLARPNQDGTAGRPRQIELERTPQQLLESYPAGEIGLTPEAYVVAFCTTLERSGEVLNAWPNSILTGACLPRSGYVPTMYWTGTSPGSVNLDWISGTTGHPGLGGALSAVQVL
jgi:hypothetical protein